MPPPSSASSPRTRSCSTSAAASTSTALVARAVGITRKGLVRTLKWWCALGARSQHLQWSWRPLRAFQGRIGDIELCPGGRSSPPNRLHQPYAVHLEDTASLFRARDRWLKPGGVLIPVQRSSWLRRRRPSGFAMNAGSAPGRAHHLELRLPAALCGQPLLAGSREQSNAHSRCWRHQCWPKPTHRGRARCSTTRRQPDR